MSDQFATDRVHNIKNVYDEFVKTEKICTHVLDMTARVQIQSSSGNGLTLHTSLSVTRTIFSKQQ